ncbi:hypothetical protein RJ639_039196 [Escallonia herrerae]|uniref:Epidermal patterning factor-like protein n=1 Tax=Escallonia herrerae TaxID=1293975 RepID=A0AA88WPU7_9ASTE|nr:hypothetical protein RJ639_039196 [Escallonia herrerae]
MGCSHNLMWNNKLRYFTISSLLLLGSISTQMRITAQGRTMVKVKPVGPSQAVVMEERMILRPQIGSRPPRCERRCGSCGHCEAIQVPTNPQTKSGSRNSTTASTITYSTNTDDNYSNYKPMSWKCKCGNFIFNP